MKLTKILILALGLMALAATGALAQEDMNVDFVYSGGSPRIIATNSDTGDTTAVRLTSQSGNAEDPAWLPGSLDPYQIQENIYFNYSHTISAVSEIDIQMFLPGDNAYLEDQFDDYGEWIFIDRTGTNIARARVGNTAGVPSQMLQIQFLEDTSFHDGSVINVEGVRVDLTGVTPGGEEVTVSFSTSEGAASISPETTLVARSTDPLTCDDCDLTIGFRSDGFAINDLTTLTIGELFDNAFEAPSRIRLRITDIPEGYDFVGIYGVSTNGDVLFGGTSCSGDTCYINIADNNTAVMEEIYVALEFDLVGTPAFNPSPANIHITLYPPGGYQIGDDMPWTIDSLYTYPLRYSNLEITCQVNFSFEESLGGRLLSVFNADYEGTWDTGFAVMNGSGADPLEGYRAWFGSWWDLPQYGTVTVYVYPQDTAVNDNDDSPYVFTTGPGVNNIGLGLDANGRVPPKGEWTVLLSEIMDLALNDDLETHSGDFSGFVIFETNFPLAEGVSYLTDWVTQAQGYSMINLLLRDPRWMDNWGWFAGPGLPE